MFDTSDPSPRAEGREIVPRRRIKVVRSVKLNRLLHKARQKSLIQFASLDQLRRIFPGHPLFQKKGEPEYSPLAEARMKALAEHAKPIPWGAQQKLKKEQGKKVTLPHGITRTKLTPEQVERYKREGPPEGARIEGEHKITEGATVRPYQGIRADISRQQKEIKQPEVSRHADYGEEKTSTLWGSTTTGGKPAKPVGEKHGLYTSWSPPAEQSKVTHLPWANRIPRPEPGNVADRERFRAEVSKLSRTRRNPIPWHEANAEFLGTPNLVRQRLKPIPGAPSKVLGKAEAVETTKEMQSVRDWLAGEAKKYRKNIPFEARKSVHPVQLYKAHKEIESQIASVTAGHHEASQKIRNQALDWARSNASSTAMGRNNATIIEKGVGNIFSLGHAPDEKDMRLLAGWMGTTRKKAAELHGQFMHHARMTTQAGEDQIRKQIIPKVFKSIPAEPPPVPQGVLKPLLTKVGIGAGVAGGAALAGYGAYRLLRKKPKEHQFARGKYIGSLLGLTDPEYWAAKKKLSKFMISVGKRAVPLKTATPTPARWGDVQTYMKRHFRPEGMPKRRPESEYIKEALSQSQAWPALEMQKVRDKLALRARKHRAIEQTIGPNAKAYQRGFREGRKGVTAAVGRERERVGGIVAERAKEAEKKAGAEAGKQIAIVRSHDVAAINDMADRSRRAAIGIGVGAAGAGVGTGYLIGRRNGNKKMQEFEAPGVTSALGRVAQKLKGPFLSNIGKKELILGGALAGGITAADAATSAVYPDPDETRGRSAWSGAKRGALYGTVLAGTELPLRRSFMKNAPPLLARSMSSKRKEIRFQQDDDKKKLAHDIAIGGIEGGTGFLATDRILKYLKPQTPVGKAVTAGVVGGIATGTIGYGLNRFLRDFKQQHKAQKKASKDLASKLREIRFARRDQKPNPLGRTAVAADKYRKIIRGREIERKESNLSKAVLAGTALGGVLKGTRGAGIGALAGLGTGAALQLVGRRTRDPYGEESISAKRIERLPYQIGGLATAGVLANRLGAGAGLKRLKQKLFLSKLPEIRFQADLTDILAAQPGRFLRHPVSGGERAYKWYGRASRIHRDLSAKTTRGGNIVDERGRERKPEWKKDWVKHAVGTGIGIAGLLAIGKGVSTVKKAAAVGVEGIKAGRQITPTERLAALTVGHPSHAWEYLKSKMPHIPGLGGLGKVGENLRQAAHEAAHGAATAIEGKTGAITGGKVIEGGGGIKRIEVQSPLAAKKASQDALSRAATLEKRAAAERHKAKRIGEQGPAEKMIADVLKEAKKNPIETSSRKALVQFQEYPPQYPQYQAVRPYFRRNRYPEGRKPPDPLHKQHPVREGVLAGTGLLATIGAARWGLTTAEARRKKEAELMASIKKIVASRPVAAGTKAAKKVVHLPIQASALLDDIIEFRIAMPKTYLIRHGCTSFNKEGLEIGQSAERIRGHIDVPLNEKGRQQAAALGKKLRGKPIDHIYASDLQRAHETAEIISEHMGGVPVTPVYGLRPWGLGSEIEGKEHTKVEGKINKLIDRPDKVPKDGESLNDFKQRFLSTVSGIREKHPQGSVAIVTHYRGLKLINSLDGDGEINPRKFKARKDTTLEPGSWEVIKHDQSGDPNTI